MKNEQIYLVPLVTITIIGIGLLLAVPAEAGQFWITEVASSQASDYGDSVMVQARSKAKYSGSVDSNDNQWQIGAHLRPAGGIWNYGSVRHGTGVYSGMIISCDYDSCGGNGVVNKCSSSNTSGAYTYKGEVSITHTSFTGNDEDGVVKIGYVNCPTDQSSSTDSGQMIDGCEPP